MTQRDPNQWMWERAADLIERAESAQRRFFHLSPGAQRPGWEPPVDVFETDAEIAVLVALPGVDLAGVEIGLEGDAVVVSARRMLPAVFAESIVRRLEIPQGRFERRIALPAGHYELHESTMEAGCLCLRLKKLVTT